MVLQEQYVDLQKKKQVIDLELEKAKIIFDHALDEMKQHNIKLKQLLKSDGAMSLLREAMVYTINNDQRGNLQAIGGDDEFMDEVLPVLQVENLGHIDEKVTNSHIYGDVLKHIHNHMRDTNKILEQLKSKDERIQAIQSLSKKDIDSQNCPVQKVLLIELKNDILKKLGEIKEQELHNKILPSGIESDISMSINDTVKIGEIHRQNQNVLESFLNDIRGNNSLRYEYDEIVKLQHSNKIQNTIEINLLAKLLDEKLIAQLLYQAQQSSLSDRQQRFLENPFEWISQEQFQGNQYIGMLQQNTKWEEECNRFINENYHDTGKYYPGNE